jgi:hypothetical protein
MRMKHLAAVIVAAVYGCAQNKTAERPETGEVKVKLSETPAAVQQTLQGELAGGRLEDIAREERAGKIVYEADIIKGGQTWEVVVGEDGSVISKMREGSAEEREADRKEAAAKGDGWRDHFDVRVSDLTPTGNNPWLTIQPGRVLKLKSGADTLTVSVLPETLQINGANVGVLEERETRGGKLIEVSRNFFATDPRTRDVYYFGEDVDNYKDGKVVNHESEWRAGRDGARFGLMVPGSPRVGDRYYQEYAPKVAMDRVEVVSVDEKVRTPAGTFEHCLHLKETTPLESGESHKWYAPGVGMIKDDEFELAEMPAK